MIKIFLDSSDINSIKEWEPKVDGFTTNPTLMRKAGVVDYEKFCKDVLTITKKPVSFEVFADEFDEMERQARIISSWGENVYVKIPITNTKGKKSLKLIKKLYKEGIKLNITAVMAFKQIFELSEVLNKKAPVIVSIFAGRIADTGIDPMKEVEIARSILNGRVELLWASPREVLNIYQAEEVGADIITCTPELIEKYQKNRKKKLKQFSLETVQMFYSDAKEAGYTL